MATELVGNIGDMEDAVLDIMQHGRKLVEGDVEDVQIVAGPKTNAATLGADAGDVAAVALGVPLAIAAGYGIYKAGSALSKDSGPSKPWLYKMSPAYWTKSAREKKFIRATKDASVEDVEKARELSEAEAAYNATQKVRTKESKIKQFEKDIDNPNAVAEAAPAAAAAPVAGGGDVVGEDMNKDAAILGALKKAGVPITANSYLGPDELLRATKIVTQISGPENAKSWLTSFMARQSISYGAPDGSTYEIQNGKPTLVSPSAPADVSTRTNATNDPGKNMRKNRRGTSSTGYFRSPWEKSLGDPTARSLAMSTVMPTTGMRGLQSPWEKGLMDRTAHSLAMSTEMPTTGVRGEEELSGLQSPWEKGLMDRTAHSLAMSTEMPTTGVRGDQYEDALGGFPRSPWEKGLGYRTVHNLAMSTSMPTTGVRGAHLMGAAAAAGPSPQEAQVLGQIVATHGNTITAIVNAKNLGAKKTWSSKDVDTVAAGLLQKMMTETGRKASADDANIARAATRFWLAKAGGSVVGMFVGGDDVGSFWSGLKTVALSPITVPYWLGKKTVQGVQAVGHKIFGGGGGPSALQKQQGMLAAAAKRKAAAQMRIAAAEQRQEAALAEKGAAQDAADQQAQALEAEAAAQAAESVAIEAEATKDVPYTPEALSGWTVVGGCPPSMVGKAALAAATDTPVGRRLRIGAFVGRAMKHSRAVRKHVAAVVGAAKAGNPKAKRQVTTIKAGIIADKQKLAAVKTNAMVTRAVATHEKRKLLAIGVSPIGLFSRIRIPMSQTRPWSPFTFGADTAAAKSKGGKQASSNVPPAIPGVPPDVLVALTASANTFGVPPMVAASVVAAAKSGDKNAIKELNDAGRVYKAAQKGDPIAKKQLASVAADMKSGYGPAAQKAAVMSAAIGMHKGTKNFANRKATAQKKTQRAVAAATAQPMPAALAPCDPVWKCPISFGRTLWS